MSSNLRMLAIALLAACLVSNAVAQDKNKKPERFTAAGTIQEINRGLIQFLTDEGDVWVIQVGQKAAVKVLGSAPASFLRPGMYVEFSVNLNSRGKAQEAVSQIRVFTPTKDQKWGVQAQSNVAASGLFSDKPMETKPPEYQPYKIAGRAAGFGRGQLAVSAGTTALRVPVAKDANLDIELADLRLARVGDKISVRGNLVGMGRGVAQMVTITSEDPYGVKKPTGKPSGN